MSELRNLSYTVKSSLRITQQAHEQLAQAILVEEKRQQDAAVLLMSALELIRDQQAFLASVARSLNTDTRQKIHALDARASTFTFIENFPSAKKEAIDGKE